MNTTATQVETITLIRQAELERYLALKNQIKKDEAELETLSEQLKNLLTSGVAVEDGAHTAEVKLSEVRRPSWKEEFSKYVDRVKGPGEGAKQIDRVIERTEPTKTFKLDVK